MIRTTTIAFSFALIAAAGAVTGVTPAQAEDFTFEVPAYLIESPQGRQAVLERLDGSVKRYCQRGGFRPLRQHLWEAECQAGLLDEMVAKIGDARLIALHEGGGAQTASK